MKKIISPLFPENSRVELEETFKSEKIISLYSSLNIDVSRFFPDKEVNLYKCKNTGYRFYYPYSTIGDAEFYEDLSKNRKNYYSERWEHKESLKYIGLNKKVLEIGSGFGAFLNMLKSKNITGKGLELNPHAVLTCKENDLDIEQKLIQELIEEQKETFDVVCFFQVLEHIPKVHDFLESAIKALKPGGKLIIGVPNNNPYLFKYDKLHTLNLPPHHAGVWNKKSLLSLEKVFPLKLEAIKFEPISLNYDYYLNVILNQSNNVFERIVYRILNKLASSILKKLICKFHKGRNVLAVYSKL